MSVFLATTFSPMMLGEGLQAFVTPADLGDIPFEAESIVGHEATATVISLLLGWQVQFNRRNITLNQGDVLFCLIPSFRAETTREFSREEIVAAGFRCFKIKVA